MVLDEVRGLPKWAEFLLRGSWMSVERFMAMHPIARGNRGISLKTKNVNLMVALEQKSVEFILHGPWTAAHDFTTIHPILVEIFQSEPKWWPTNQHIILTVLLLVLRMIKNKQNKKQIYALVFQLWKLSFISLFSLQENQSSIITSSILVKQVKLKCLGCSLVSTTTVLTSRGKSELFTLLLRFLVRVSSKLWQLTKI